MARVSTDRLFPFCIPPNTGDPANGITLTKAEVVELFWRVRSFSIEGAINVDVTTDDTAHSGGSPITDSVNWTITGGEILTSPGLRSEADLMCGNSYEAGIFPFRGELQWAALGSYVETGEITETAAIVSDPSISISQSFTFESAFGLLLDPAQLFYIDANTFVWYPAVGFSVDASVYWGTADASPSVWIGRGIGSTFHTYTPYPDLEHYDAIYREDVGFGTIGSFTYKGKSCPLSAYGTTLVNGRPFDNFFVLGASFGEVSLELVPVSYHPYDPGDGGGPVWDAATGAQLRDPWSIP